MSKEATISLFYRNRPALISYARSLLCPNLANEEVNYTPACRLEKSSGVILLQLLLFVVVVVVVIFLCISAIDVLVANVVVDFVCKNFCTLT